MDLRLVLVACLVGLACCQFPPDDFEDVDPADKCDGRDCPQYSVEEEGDGFEVRQYEPAKWAAVTLPTEGSWRQKRRTMEKLRNYFEGENSQDLELEPTAPMLKKLEGEFNTTDFRKTVLFMLPFDQQADPPQPTDSDVTLVDMPAMTVYAGEMERPARPGRGRGGPPRRGGPGGRWGGRRGARRGGRWGARGNQGEDQDADNAAVRRFRRHGRRGGRRGGRGHGNRAARWQQYLNGQVDALREKLGDRTVQENVKYMAMYGPPHHGGVKELWLLPAKTEA